MITNGITILDIASIINISNSLPCCRSWEGVKMMMRVMVMMVVMVMMIEMVIMFGDNDFGDFRR